MPNPFYSATIRLALLFLFVAVVLIVFDWAALYFSGQGIRYLPELFGVLMAPMFIAIAGKNAADNFIAYRKETTQYTQSETSPLGYNSPYGKVAPVEPKS